MLCCFGRLLRSQTLKRDGSSVAVVSWWELSGLLLRLLIFPFSLFLHDRTLLLVEGGGRWLLYLDCLLRFRSMCRWTWQKSRSGTRGEPLDQSPQRPLRYREFSEPCDISTRNGASNTSNGSQMPTSLATERSPDGERRDSMVTQRRLPLPIYSDRVSSSTWLWSPTESHRPPPPLSSRVGHLTRVLTDSDQLRRWLPPDHHRSGILTDHSNRSPTKSEDVEPSDRKEPPPTVDRTARET